MRIAHKPSRAEDHAFCIVLVGILLAGLFLFASMITSTDDEQLFASAAQSYAQRSAFTALQMWGNERVLGRYSMIAPLHVLIGSLAYRLAQWLQVGRLQFFYVLSPLYTATTAWLVMQMALWRGYSRKTVALAGLAFTFTTIAFPYAKTFFREPLAMLLLVSAFAIVDGAIRQPRSLPVNLVRLFVALAIFLLAVWTKEFLVACLPFWVYLVFKNKRALFPAEKEKGRKTLKWAMVALLVLLAALTIWLWQDRAGRFSISYLTRLITYQPIMPHENFFSALWGMLLGASKGFFVYSPLLLLGLIFPFSAYWKEGKQDWVIAMGSTLGVAGGQAFAYDASWSTFTWSTRFLLPLLPLWMLVLLPYLDVAGKKGGPRWKVGVIVLLVMGLLFQLGAVLISDADYIEFLWQRLNILVEGVEVTRWEMLPAVGHWLALAHGVRIDLGWVRGIQAQLNSILVAPIACGLLALLGWLILWNQRFYQPFLIVLFLLLIVCLPVWVVNASRVDPLYSGYRLSYRDVLEYLQAKSMPADAILIDGYNHPYWYYHFNFSSMSNEWIGLPEGVRTTQGYSLYPRLYDTVQFLNAQKASGERVWLVSERGNTWHPLTYGDVLASNGWKIVARKTFTREGEPSVVMVDELIKK